MTRTWMVLVMGGVSWSAFNSTLGDQKKREGQIAMSSVCLLTK